MAQRIAMQRWCGGFGTEEKGGPDLRSGRSKCKCGGNTTAVGNPAGGYDRHADSIRDLRHQRQCAGLRGNRDVEVGSEENPPMSTGFISLSDDRIYAPRFQPERL